MTEEKKSLFGRIFGVSKKECCCKIQIIEESDDRAPETVSDTESGCDRQTTNNDTSE